VNRVDVSQASLSHYSIGPTIGIAGLPQDLPTSADLVRGPWSVCASGVTSTLVGGRSVGGTPLSPNQTALVSTGQGADWMLWNGERLLISQRIMQSLYGAGDLQIVPASWLDAISRGPDFAAPAISGQGDLVHGPSGPAQVGRVYSEQGTTQDFVLQADGRLATVTAAQAALLEREPGEPAPQSISPSAVTSDLSGTAVADNGLPAKVPTLPSAMTMPLCETYGPGLRPGITTGGAVPAGAVPTGAAPTGAAPTGAAPVTAGGAGINQVWLPPDHGALVGAAPSTDQPGTVIAWFLVTGATRYALPESSVATALGYNLSTEQTALPASVLELLPQGPVMEPTAATERADG
jgi:hypothetical protein